MEIGLLRHGEPEAVSNSPVSASDFAEWIKHYNRAGLAAGSTPPATTLEFVRTCGVIAGSTLPRSIQSAEVLSTDNILEPDSLFSEVDMPYTKWRTFRLAPKYWAVLFRVLWYLGYSRDCENYAMARRRAAEAAKNLVHIAETRQSVLLVGHGIFNRLLAKELITLGWSGPQSPGSRYWSLAVYTKCPEPSIAATRHSRRGAS